MLIITFASENISTRFRNQLHGLFCCEKHITFAKLHGLSLIAREHLAVES